MQNTELVTSYAEVWIEIVLRKAYAKNRVRHLLRGGVDWNPVDEKTGKPIKRHLLRGGVDWNLKNFAIWRVNTGHLLRGGVDWNAALAWHLSMRLVTSYAEVWIEIGYYQLQVYRQHRHLLRGGVDWNQNNQAFQQQQM